MCFNRPLQSRELEGVKEVVAMSEEEGIRDGGLTQLGFLFLHTFFIQKGRLETTWTALRKFGYGEDLTLREEFLFPRLVGFPYCFKRLRKEGSANWSGTRFDIPTDCTAELSPKGYQFLTDLFEKFDKASLPHHIQPPLSSPLVLTSIFESNQDHDGALSTTELDDLFSTSPGNPWIATGFPETTITSESNAVTLQGWLAQWRYVLLVLPSHSSPSFPAHSPALINQPTSMTTLLEPRVTLSYLAYLGYPHSSMSSPTLLPTTSALTLTRPRKVDRKKGVVSRNVLLGYVLGAAGSGKTAILRKFVGKALEEKFEPTSRIKTVVNSVESGGGERYLVLQEFGSEYESEVLRVQKKLGLADVLVFVYDSSDTNSFCELGLRSSLGVGELFADASFVLPIRLLLAYISNLRVSGFIASVVLSN